MRFVPGHALVRGLSMLVLMPLLLLGGACNHGSNSSSAARGGGSGSMATRAPMPQGSGTPSVASRPMSPQVRAVAHQPAPRQMGRADAPTGRAASVLLVDARTGEVLATKNPDQRRQVASTQKLLTALLVVEAGNLDRTITIQPSDTRVEPSKLGFAVGDRYTRKQLLEAILVRSSNDAALALARDHSGSVSAFVARMNERARELGCQDSNFRNPHGLTEPGQYSTARDVSRIAWVAYRNSTIRSIVQRERVQFRYANGRVTTLTNTNRLLGSMSGCNGMKTGFTNAAGRCLVSTASSGGREVILVQLGSKTAWIFDDARALKLYGLQSGQQRRMASVN